MNHEISFEPVSQQFGGVSRKDHLIGRLIAGGTLALGSLIGVGVRPGEAAVSHDTLQPHTDSPITYSEGVGGNSSLCGLQMDVYNLPYEPTYNTETDVYFNVTANNGQTIDNDEIVDYGQNSGPGSNVSDGVNLSTSNAPPPGTYNININWQTTDGSGRQGNYNNTITVNANCVQTSSTDGGANGGYSVTNNSTSGLTAAVAGVAETPDGKGLVIVGSDGSVETAGDAQFYGSEAGKTLNAPIVAVAETPDGKGYWLLGADGGIFTFGDAQFFGSTGGMRLNQPVVAMAPTPDGNGYWLVAKDGGVFTFGDAQFYGSMGGVRLNKPINAMAMVDQNNGQEIGYTMAASDGGIFNFGSPAPTPFYGSTGNLKLAAPITDMASTPDGKGYMLVGKDGGVFTFGDAQFEGSAANTGLQFAGIALTPDGKGYWLVATSSNPADNGKIFSYGDAAPLS